MVSLIEAAVVADLKEFLTPERFETTLTQAASAQADSARIEADRQSIKADIAKVDRELANLAEFAARGDGFESIKTPSESASLPRGTWCGNSRSSTRSWPP